MTGFILGKKQSVKQIFTEAGEAIAVTSVAVDPCYLVSWRTQEKDGYNAVVLGYGTAKHSGKAKAGQLKKAGIKAPLRFLREIRFRSPMVIEKEEGKETLTLGENKLVLGDKLTGEKMFTLGTKLTVTGRAKGKGFAGVVKRHGFAGGPATHGQSDRHRAPGSIGASTTPGRVMVGKRMAGRMGGQQVTMRGFKLVAATENEILIKGVVPGARGSLLVITA